MEFSNTTSSPTSASAQLAEAVAFFEQMLQTMPDDRMSLDVLSQAYEQAGEAVKACDLLSRLAHVIERDHDVAAATALQPRLAKYAGNTNADMAMAQLLRFLAAATPQEPEKPIAAADDDNRAADALQLISGPAERRALATQELEFAWLLHEKELLTEDQYATVVSDITDLSASATPLPVSVLHLYHDRQFSGLERILAFTIEKSGVPLLPLSAFEPQSAAYGLLPLDYLVVKGVVPFELMSRDLLVAMLNPLNEILRREIEKLTGRSCHFYLVHPADFDTTMDKIRKLSRGPALAKLK